jgi:hypothetical protein
VPIKIIRGEPLTYKESITVADDTVIVIKYRAIKVKEIYYSDDGIIRNENLASEGSDEEHLGDFYEDDYSEQCLPRPTSAASRAKTKSQYALSTMTVGMYTEKLGQEHFNDNVYAFLRRAKVDLLADKIWEVGYYYVREKVIQVFVDKQKEPQLELTAVIGQGRDRHSIELPSDEVLDSIDYDKKILEVVLVMKSETQTRTASDDALHVQSDLEISIKMLTDTDDKEKLKVRIKTKKWQSR